MTIQSCGGAECAVCEILDLIKRLEEEDQLDSTIIEKVKLLCDDIKRAAETGWY